MEDTLIAAATSITGKARKRNASPCGDAGSISGNSTQSRRNGTGRTRKRERTPEEEKQAFLELVQQGVRNLVLAGVPIYNKQNSGYLAIAITGAWICTCGWWNSGNTCANCHTGKT